MKPFFAIAFLFFLLVGTFSCSYKSAIVKTDLADRRTQRLRMESDVSGRFFVKREFHQGLIQETKQPQVAPYPQLDSLFRNMHRSANELILSRKRADSASVVFTRQLNDREKFSKKSALSSKYQEAIFSDDLESLVMSVSKAEFDVFEMDYDSIIASHSISRTNHDQWIEEVGKLIYQWQDSLETQGRVIASLKGDLKKRYPEQKGSDFFKSYQPVSEMEASTKVFQQSVGQLENAFSRIELGNQEEFYFEGPFIEERTEITSVELINEQLTSQMVDFRLLERAYLNRSFQH